MRSAHFAMPRAFAILAIVGIVLSPAVRAQSGENFDRGLVEFRAGNCVAANELFARAESATPGKTDALLYRAKCLVQIQNFAEAEGSLRRYISAHAGAADAYYLLGFVLNRQNRAVDSLRVYTQASALAPAAGDDLKIVGLDYVLLGDYADAIKWLEKSVERDSKNEDAWYYLGRAYYTKAQMGKARKAFETVLALDPRSWKAKNNLGLILETEGKPAEALQAYRTAITWQEKELHPNEQPYVNLGNLLMEQGQIKESIPSLEKAVSLAPNNAFCHMTLGIAYRQAGQLEGAQRELEKATQLEPDNAKAHYQLGRLYKDVHAIDRAKAEFNRTQELQQRALR